MKKSFKIRQPVKLHSVSTVATGLAPPYAGKVYLTTFVKTEVLHGYNHSTDNL